MTKFTVSFNGRPEDLLREIGMSLNGLIRRLVGENHTKPARVSFLRPENAEVGWIRDHVAFQVALALSMRPEERRPLGALLPMVKEHYKGDVDRWIEDNRVNLAELGFIRDENEQEKAKFDRFGRRVW